MSSYIDFEDHENNKLLFSSQSKIEIPRPQLSLYINDDLTEVVSLKKTFTTEIKPKYIQNDFLMNIPNSSNNFYKDGIFRSFSLSRHSFVQNSPLMYFKKNAYINNITIVNNLASINTLLSRHSSNLNSKFSTKVNILQLGLSSGERKLTSNQISCVLKPRLLGETEKKKKSIFATQISNQIINKKNDNNYLNKIINPTEPNKSIKDNNLYSINIFQPQTESSLEFENIKKQITQTAKCVYPHNFSDFWGFAAFTFKTNEETFLDKIDIVLNKELHSKTSSNEFCHCFGMFPYMNENDDISSMLKERFHKHLLHRKDFLSNTTKAILDTYNHFDKKIHRENNNNNNNNNSNNSKNISFPTLLSLILINDHIYIANNSSVKCISFNFETMNISALSKKQIPTIITSFKDEFSEKKQPSHNSIPNKSLSHTLSLKSVQSQKIHYNNHPTITELSLNHLHNQEQIDFIVIVNDNVSNVLSNKEIVLAILSSLSSNTLSYERTLETAIDSICIEATKKHAKFPLSVLFLPMKGYHSIVNGNSNTTQQHINEIITKLKTNLIDEETLHNQCFVFKNHRKKTSEITVHNHLKCHSCTQDAIELKDNDVSSSFNSYSSISNYERSSNSKGVEKCKKAKKMFCGCFA